MQPTLAGTSNSSGGDGGAGGQSRAGLARFRSAPATWLEALLEDEEEDPLKPGPNLTQLLASSASPAPRNSSLPFVSSSSVVEPALFEPPAFQRQNSSPADFLGNSGIGNDAFFSSFGIPSNYDYLSPNSDVSPSGKRGRGAELQSSPAGLPQIKGEQSGQGPARASSLIEMEMDKLLEDSVPCRVRAKRGCATHPRSIAERVRRTRISDRIRKLQELVPNMDKQTNTADMLEEAVEYVKFLQKQIQELTEHQRKCRCMVKE